jgi:hypothetical protein
LFAKKPHFYVFSILGRSDGSKGGSISVTIVIIVSWLVIGLVVYALAQVSILRRMSREDQEAEKDFLLQQQLLLTTPPTLLTTPPTPKDQNGTIVGQNVLFSSRFLIKIFF